MQQCGHWQPRRPSKKARQTLCQANSVYNLPSIKHAIKWMHAVCGHPVKTRWVKAAKTGNFVGWPLLTVKNINKYYPEMDETLKGHMNQQCKNVRSTKKPFEECNAAAALHLKKVKDIYARTYNTNKMTFSDQTSQFPMQSKRVKNTSWSWSKLTATPY
jgi:hypothetical protein